MRDCLASRASTLDFWLLINRSTKLFIQGLIKIKKILSQNPTLLQAKMAQQGEQMSVRAWKALHTIE